MVEHCPRNPRKRGKNHHRVLIISDGLKENSSTVVLIPTRPNDPLLTVSVQVSYRGRCEKASKPSAEPPQEFKTNTVTPRARVLHVTATYPLNSSLPLPPSFSSSLSIPPLAFSPTLPHSFRRGIVSCIFPNDIYLTALTKRVCVFSFNFYPTQLWWCSSLDTRCVRSPQTRIASGVAFMNETKNTRKDSVC